MLLDLRKLTSDNLFSYLYSSNALLCTTLKSHTTLNLQNFFFYNNTLSVTYNLLNLRSTFMPIYFFCLDMWFNPKNDNKYLIYNFGSLFSNFRLTITVFPIFKNLINSHCFLFKNLIWLEREIIDFSSLYIRGLLDSRRLLTDYLQNRQYPLDLQVYDFTYSHYIQELYTL